MCNRLSKEIARPGVVIGRGSHVRANAASRLAGIEIARSPVT